MAGSGLKLLEMAGNSWNGWKWLEIVGMKGMAGNGGKWLEMAGNF